MWNGGDVKSFDNQKYEPLQYVDLQPAMVAGKPARNHPCCKAAYGNTGKKVEIRATICAWNGELIVSPLDAIE